MASVVMRMDIVGPWHTRSHDEIMHRAGQGNWGAARSLGLGEDFFVPVAERWRAALKSVRLPWLCWNVDDDWCLVQQKLVESVGWTPVVGFDPRVGPPKKTTPNAIVIDFNDRLGFPVLYPHVPIEFAFIFADRLAFWHSDLLIRPALMQALAGQFAALKDQTAATEIKPGLRQMFSISRKRRWELVGCTTKVASYLQWRDGCGWWMEFWNHPNFHGDRKAASEQWYWDHGAGVYFWEKARRGKVKLIRDKAIHEGHFTKIGRKDYKRSVVVGTSDAQRSMAQEIADNFDLRAACERMGLKESQRAEDQGPHPHFPETGPAR